MNAFEHLMTFVSFIFALALTHLLASIVALVRAGARVRHSALHATWMATAFVTLFMNWLSFWDLRALLHWTLISMVLMFAVSIAQYFVCAFVSPDVPAEGHIDLREFHAAEGRTYIWAMLGLFGLALVANLYFGSMYDVGSWLLENVIVVAVLPFLLLALFVRANWAQVVSAAVVFTLNVAFLLEFEKAIKLTTARAHASGARAHLLEFAARHFLPIGDVVTGGLGVLP